MDVFFFVLDWLRSSPPARAAPHRGCVQQPLHPRHSLEETQPRFPPSAACPGGDSTPRRTPGEAQGLGGEEPAPHHVLVRGARTPCSQGHGSLAMRDRPLRPCHLPAAPRTCGRRAAPTRTASPPSCSHPDLHSPNPTQFFGFLVRARTGPKPSSRPPGQPLSRARPFSGQQWSPVYFWGGSLQGDGGGFGQAGKNP